jgi:aspartate ammonia-lyase
MYSMRGGMSAANNKRIEHDLLGDFAVPADAYYGVQTARALENFRISGVELRLYPNFIKALAMVKLAAARANHDVGEFSREILSAIEGACQEIISGKLHDEFRLDVLQGGAGTSTNMNANEVIANRALELMGHQKGEYKYLDPPTTRIRRRCTWAWRWATSSWWPPSGS